MSDLYYVFIGVIIGITLAVIMVIFVVWYLKKKSEESKPFVEIFELDTFKKYPLGKFKDYDDNIIIQVDGQSKYKRFWSLITDSYVVVPCYGEKNDIVIRDPNSPGIITLVCSVIGFGWQEDAHAKWLEKAFPPDIYENPPTSLDGRLNNYIFVEPYGKQEWVKSRYLNMRQLFSQMNKISAQYERTNELIHEGYAKLIISRIQSWNEIMVSSWNHLLEGWNTTRKYNVTPLVVLCRLLHIPLNRLVYSGINEVLMHGGMREIANVAGMIRGGLDALNQGFGRVSIEEPLLKATAEKSKQLMQKLAQAEQEKYMYQNQLQRILSSITGGVPSPPLLQEQTSRQRQQSNDETEGETEQ